MIDKKKKILKNLVCPNCFKELNLFSDKLICGHCPKEYPLIDKRPFLLDESGRGFKESSNDILINKLKIFFKKYPLIFNLFFYVFGASLVGKSPKKAIEGIGSHKLILNLGSGIRKIREDVINIDFYPFNNVDLIADISHLPFKDNSIEAIINEFVLEHIKEPEKVIAEIYRVLRPGGLIYLTAPFLVSFHSSPDDYCRWSKNGLKELMKEFQADEIGIRSGPTASLLSILNGWLALVLSFGSKTIQQVLLMFLTILTSPFKVLDYFLSKLPNAENIALGFYYLGRKKVEVTRGQPPRQQA